MLEWSRLKNATIFLLGPILLSCTNTSPPQQEVISISISAPVASLNPLYATDANTQHINDLAHAALLKNSEALVPEPYLAESFQNISSTKIKFHLRKGCLFSNGKEITSQDVVRSWRYFIDQQNASPFADSLGKIQSIDILDPYTLQMNLVAPTPGLISDLYSLKILSLDPPPPPGEKPAILIGAGPYQVESMQPGLILLKRSSQGCLPAAKSTYIRIKVVRDDLSRFLKLKNGELDIVLNEMNYRKVEVAENDPSLDLQVIKAPGIGYNYIGINMLSSHLRDKRIREALALSFDIPALIKYKSRGMGDPARNLLADQNYYANKSVPIRQRNLVRSKQLLDEAGFYNGSNQKPVLQLSLKTTNNLIAIENAKVLVAQAKEAGIQINHQPFEWGIFYNDVKTGNTELYALRWVGVTDPGIYYEVFHSNEIGKSNRTQYKNKEMDHYLEIGQSTLDPKKRKAAFDKVQELAYQDLPFIGLWYPMNTAVYRKNVKGVRLHPTGSWRPLQEVSKE